MTTAMRVLITVVPIMMHCACDSSTGPRIGINDLNFQRLCDYPVSGVSSEERCVNDTACTTEGHTCWQPESLEGQTCNVDTDCDQGYLCYQAICYKECNNDEDCLDQPNEQRCLNNGDDTKACRLNGYCRECRVDTECDLGLVCDHGWCTKACDVDSDCPAGKYCTGNRCRRRYSTSFSFYNSGDAKLEIYPSQTQVLGDSDANVFCEMEWDSADDPIVLTPTGVDSAFLKVYFRPPETGAYYTQINIFSNDAQTASLPLIICAYAVEYACSTSLDGAGCIKCAPNCTSTDDLANFASKPQVCQ